MSHVSPVRGMRYNCSQRWEDMRPMGDDRFCESCQKPVIDFTSWDRPALVAWFKEHPDACGQFRLDQVQPELKPLPELPRDLLRGAFAALAALSITTARAQQEPSVPAPTEQHATRPLGESEAVDRSVREQDERCWEEKEAGAVSKARRSRLYVSWRFPFIHRHRVVRGRIRFTGCPSF